MNNLVTARQVAAVVGLSERRIHELAAAGRIPRVAHGKQYRYDPDAVKAAVEAMRRSRQQPQGFKRCYVCKQELPVDAFSTITRSDKRCKTGHSWTGPAAECRECSKEQKREWRRKRAEARGKIFAPRGDRAAYEEQARASREKRKEEAQARAQARNAETAAIAAQRREALASAPSLTCTRCHTTKNRSDFYPSMLRLADVVCIPCVAVRDAAKFQRDKEMLSDRYVKRQLTKYSGLSADAIPLAMIEAKRAQLMIERLMPIESERYAMWLTWALRDGPVDAEALNRAAIAAGFSRSRVQSDKDFRKVRRDVATYDEQTKTWRMK